jgi:hypothetical protein
MLSATQPNMAWKKSELRLAIPRWRGLSGVHQPDHNHTRQTAATTDWQIEQRQVSHGVPQSARILQARGHSRGALVLRRPLRDQTGSCMDSGEPVGGRAGVGGTPLRRYSHVRLPPTIVHVGPLGRWRTEGGALIAIEGLTDDRCDLCPDRNVAWDIGNSACRDTSRTSRS